MFFVGCYYLPIIEDFDFAVFVPYNHLFSAILPGNAVSYAVKAQEAVFVDFPYFFKEFLVSVRGRGEV